VLNKTKILKLCWGLKTHLHASLTWTLAGNEWLPSCLACFVSRKISSLLMETEYG